MFHQQSGHGDIIIGSGPNQRNRRRIELHRALGPQAVDNLSRLTGVAAPDVLSELSRVLPSVIDRLTPQGPGGRWNAFGDEVLIMPGMDGNEIVLWLAQQKCTARLIIITGFTPDYAAHAKVLAEYKGLEPVTTLYKPIELSELRAVLGSQKILLGLAR